MKAFLKIVILTSFLCFGSAAFAENMSAVDKEIVSNIQHRFAAEQATSGAKVVIVSHEGMVTLTGKVDTDGEASKLVEIAQATPGVKDVNAKSIVIKQSNQPLTDTVITAKVKGVFIREKLLGDKDISVSGIKVETTDGTVYLTGDVENQAQIDNAIKLSKSVTGVKKVESKLMVK